METGSAASPFLETGRLHLRLAGTRTRRSGFAADSTWSDAKARGRASWIPPVGPQLGSATCETLPPSPPRYFLFFFKMKLLHKRQRGVGLTELLPPFCRLLGQEANCWMTCRRSVSAALRVEMSENELKGGGGKKEVGTTIVADC